MRQVGRPEFLGRGGVADRCNAARRRGVERHDDYRPSEVDASAVAGGQRAVVEDGAQDRKEIRVGAVDVAQQDDRCGVLPDGLGQGAVMAFGVRVDQAGHLLRIHAGGQVEPDQRVRPARTSASASAMRRLPVPAGPASSSTPAGRSGSLNPVCSRRRVLASCSTAAPALRPLPSGG